MTTFVAISAMHMDLESIIKSFSVITQDCYDSLKLLHNYSSETSLLLNKSIHAWIQLSIKNKDPVLLHTGISSIVSVIADDVANSDKHDLWAKWLDIRIDAALHHGLEDPGNDADMSDILNWCSNLRHILSDTFRFDGVSAKVSGRTKLLKLIKSVDGTNGLDFLESQWSVSNENVVDDFESWLHKQQDLIALVSKSNTSKPKKEIILYAKRINQLNSRKQELEKLLISISLWAGRLNKLISHGSHKISLPDFQWFTVCCRQWAVDVQKYCYNQDSKSKPDLKLLKSAYLSIKIRD